MGSLTDSSEAALLDHVCNSAYSPVATVYLALATGDPTDAATGASFTESTVIDTTAMLLSVFPSLTVKEKLSDP